ncbi:hypothetical protein R7D97_25580 [Vibrio sp. Vb5031]|uniref:Uncharacterized protein n=2 Tax=Vibrio TaxID=662 RepID=A0A1B1LRW6_VIBPH|nr:MULTISPECIES: hypothetical protein [Vibrio]KOO05183.1 hypothetical protein AKJ31_21500 [Vibrio hepatarius]POC39313.1 hypothetical protein CRN55_08780 [Vibrio vulnificus]BEI26436.1 hypothetical protein KKIDH5335_47680 [Vibrio fluvialis]ANS55803.1 hypothetical protein [Vibrio parahaemolyticus]MCA2422688.1 hypothetical protein [Vibrio alginolyticus]
MTPYKKSFGQWVSVGESLPTTDGKYMCKIERAGVEIEALRLLKGNHWGRLRKRKIKHAKPVAAVAMA